MKTKLTFSIVLFLFISCIATKRVAVVTLTSEIVEEMVTPNFEKIDPRIAQIIDSRFSSKDTLKKAPYLPNKDDTVVDLAYDKITINNSNHSILKTIKFQTGGGEHELFELLTPYLYIVKAFYTNGNIKNKSAGSFLGCQIGKRYSFNENGKLTEVKDNDIGYTFNFDNVLKFCSKNNISLLPKTNIEYKRRIEKRKYLGNPAWFITAFYPSKKKWVLIILDGKTGHVKDILPGPIYL